MWKKHIEVLFVQKIQTNWNQMIIFIQFPLLTGEATRQMETWKQMVIEIVTNAPPHPSNNCQLEDDDDDDALGCLQLCTVIYSSLVKLDSTTGVTIWIIVIDGQDCNGDDDDDDAAADDDDD